MPGGPARGAQAWETPVQLLLKLSRAIDWINSQVGKLMIWLIFAATAISALNAVVRKIFNYSSNGFLEVQWYLFAWAFLGAAGYTLLHNEHVRIDVLNDHLPQKLRIWIEIIGYTLFLTPLCVLVIYLCVPIAIQKYQWGEMSGNPGGLIRWPVWAALPLGFGLLMLQGWSQLIKCIAYLQGKAPDPTVRGGPEEPEPDAALPPLATQSAAADAGPPARHDS